MDKYYKKWFPVLILPALIFYVWIVLFPFLQGVLYSFTSWRGTYFAGGSLSNSFVGFSNYTKVFTSGQFLHSLLYTAGFTVLSLIAINVSALVLALLATSIKKGSGAFRTIFFLPNMLGGLALGFVWQFIFQVVFTELLFSPDGVIHVEFLRYMTQDPFKAMVALVIMMTWQNAGYMMLIYVIGLNSISSDVYEAASIDGANSIQTFFHIKLPLLMPSITVVLFLVLSNSFKLLDQNIALTNGDYNTRMLALQILRTIKDNNPPNYGVAQAQAVIFFLIVAVISLLQVTATRKREVES